MKEVLLIGTGNMAKEYAKILIAQGISFVTVGRSSKGCESFKSEIGLDAISGGIKPFLEQNGNTIKTAIVCTSIEELADTTLDLIHNGFDNILVEKPGGINTTEIALLDKKAKQYNANVFVGYNRRFYRSVEKALEIINSDGGVTSFQFEFTEWGHVIRGLDKSQLVKDEWLLANSSHVIDMAFFLGGKPKEMHSYCQGRVEWGNCCATYAGAGISDKGALFNYCANWSAPGRWEVEILTAQHRLIFKPLEKLQIQGIGSTEITDVNIETGLDIQYKPGLYKQVQAFLNLDKESLLSIADQHLNMKFYDQIKNRMD